MIYNCNFDNKEYCHISIINKKTYNKNISSKIKV